MFGMIPNLAKESAVAAFENSPGGMFKSFVTGKDVGRSPAEVVKRALDGDNMMQDLSDQLGRDADTLWNSLAKRNKKAMERAAEIGAGELIDVMTPKILENITTEIPEWLKLNTTGESVDLIDKPIDGSSWESSAFDVNSQQARGLSMGGSYIDDEGKEQVTLLTAIKDILKQASTNGSLVWS